MSCVGLDPIVKATPRDLPLLVFDGDCAFCRRWIARWQRRTGGAVEYAPFQEAATSLPQIPPDVFTKAVVFIWPSGRIALGADAVFDLCNFMPSWRWLTSLSHFPGLLPIARLVYRWVAANRSTVSRLGI